MPLSLDVQDTRLIAVQTGSLDWQDTDRAFDRCEAVLSDHPKVSQLLLDLSNARLNLTAAEAAQLAGIVTLTFSRRIRTAIVSPPEPEAFELVSGYAASLASRGVPVAACRSLEEACRFLDAATRRSCRLGRVSMVARLIGLFRRGRQRRPA